MSFSHFPTIDCHIKGQSPDFRNPAISCTPWLSMAVRGGARVALQQRSILRTNILIRSNKVSYFSCFVVLTLGFTLNLEDAHRFFFSVFEHLKRCKHMLFMFLICVFCVYLCSIFLGTQILRYAALLSTSFRDTCTCGESAGERRVMLSRFFKIFHWPKACRWHVQNNG